MPEHIDRVHPLQDTHERDDPSNHEDRRPIDPANAFGPRLRVHQCECGAEPECDHADIRLEPHREAHDDGENQAGDAYERQDLM